MSSRSDVFECHWQPSRGLLVGYGLSQLLAWGAIGSSDAPLALQGILLLGCLFHAGRVLPRYVRLTHPEAWRGLRHDEQGWQLWNAAAGWQPVQLRRDSLALPIAVVLRFRLPGQRGACGICIPRDAMPPDQHRRLRVRLKFSRRRWAAPE